MKKSTLFISFLFIIFMNSCGKKYEVVTFTTPQPTETKDLKKFPKKLFGEYLSSDEISRLKISKSMIEKIYDYRTKIHPNELDSNSTIKGCYIIDLKTKEKTLFKRVNDSLEVNIVFTDTIFNLNDEDILRKYKGYYFLNKRSGNGWEVQKLFLKKGKLYLSVITNESEINQLKQVSESYEDTISPYNFKIKKKEFKGFILGDGFSTTDTLIKIRK